MLMKFFSPLTAEFFPNEPDWENESYNEYEGCPLDGHDLLQYADVVDEAVKKDIADFNGDLMQYYHEDDFVRRKVVSAVPSAEICGNKLCGCLTVELKEALLDDEQTVLCNYISGQYSDGWGEGFEQRDIRVEDGTLAVHFWQEDGFKMTPTFEKTQEQVQMTQRPKMKCDRVQKTAEPPEEAQDAAAWAGRQHFRHHGASIPAAERKRAER